jgi:DNA helicase-2/ATP-dependent DNA helicase PcrA
MLISEIEYCIEKGYQSIGLICKTEKNALSLFASLKDRVDVQIIKNESTAELQGVFIIPVYMSKGLEFDAVLICDTDSINYHSEDDKKLLYIASTRALHRLNLFCKGEASSLL